MFTITIILISVILYSCLITYLLNNYYKGNKQKSNYSYIGKDVHKMDILDNQQINKRES